MNSKDALDNPAAGHEYRDNTEDMVIKSDDEKEKVTESIKPNTITEITEPDLENVDGISRKKPKKKERVTVDISMVPEKIKVLK